MTTPRPVRYRCEIAAQVELDTGADPVRARVLELSETGAFLEEVPGLDDVQGGEGAVIGIPLPGGEPWVSHIKFLRAGAGRVDVRTPRAEHVSVLVRGYGVEFDQVQDDELERLRDFLELLDNR